jgi:Uri superfamily endonuclease
MTLMLLKVYINKDKIITVGETVHHVKMGCFEYGGASFGSIN